MIVTCLSAKLYTLESLEPKHSETKAPRGSLKTEVLRDVIRLKDVEAAIFQPCEY
jgi:hypothetical protein